jgi:hypothetical protein
VLICFKVVPIHYQRMPEMAKDLKLGPELGPWKTVLIW